MTETVHTQTTFQHADVMQAAYNSLTHEEKARINLAVTYLKENEDVTHDGMGLTVIDGKVYLDMPGVRGSLQMAIDRKRHELALFHALSCERFPKFREGKVYWFIDTDGCARTSHCDCRAAFDLAMMLMGNYFETQREALAAKDDVMKKYESLKVRNII